MNGFTVLHWRTVMALHGILSDRLGVVVESFDVTLDPTAHAFQVRIGPESCDITMAEITEWLHLHPEAWTWEADFKTDP